MADLSRQGGIFWQEQPDRLFEALSTSQSGLTQGEAERRLKQYGANVSIPVPRPHPVRRIVRRLTEPLVAILLVAATLSGLVGDPVGASIIIVVVGFSIALDLFQEHKAEVAADALRRSVAIKVDTIRDGQPMQILAEDVVPGDVIVLKAGDLIPADGIVLASTNAHANETALTGESYPAEKQPGPSTATTAAEAANALFAGTSLISGEARMLVVRTGSATEFGGIAGSLVERRPPTEFERGLNRLGYLILRLTVFLSLFVLLVHLVNHRPVIESFLFAIALAVGLTPELLPMVTTVALARGAIRMAERKVIVKRLSAIHDLGAVDIFCTDKTGTLTEARIVLTASPDVSGTASSRVLELAAVNAWFETGIRSPLDDAILAAAGPNSGNGWTKVAEVPFDFERRRISVLARHGSESILLIKGAPEELLAISTHYELPGGEVRDLDDDARANIKGLHDQYAGEGQRLLGVAWRPMPADRSELAPEDEQDLIFTGYCAFLDPPKASAAEALSRLAAAGVRTKVISGDNQLVVRHLVETLGLPLKGVLTGREMEDLGDAALAAAVEQNDLFCRISPDQKKRIVGALKARGHTVGFMGDGINDAPAIRRADVGISVEGATEVAREAADMILLQADLGVLADGIEEGRRTFSNILKYVRMGTSSNLGNMLSMAAASIWLPFLPLTPVQILINNLLYDSSEIGIPFDRVERTELLSPATWDMSLILRFMVILGPLSSVFDIITFLMLQNVFGVSVEEFRTAWFIESMATQILVIFVIRTSQPAWRSWPHPLLTVTSLVALALAFVLALSPLGRAIGFSAPSGTVLLAVLLVVVAYLVAAELLKGFAMRPSKKTHRARNRILG